MADVIIDGFVRVSWVPTIANIAAPTVAELNAGTVLSGTLVPGGLEGFEPSPASVDNSSFDSTFDTKLSGIPAYSGSGLVLKKQASGDTVFALFGTPGTNGYIVVRRNIAATTAWATSQSVEVYPVNIGQRWPLLPERNTVSKYRVQAEVSSSPNLNATTA